MYIEQMYTGCLAEAAYYIESDGKALIIDPMRETAPYLEKAKERGAEIEYVFETHFHADFVSGHLDLAKKTGAEIVYGPTAETGFAATVATDGQEFSVGKVKLKVLHTPGHTPESSSFLLFDEAGKEHAVFTGDTLFVGEVGRPDLAVKTDLTQADLAGMLYESLRNKLMVLPDDVTVYPAHGAGSACGKNISDERFSTIGKQRATNYALQPMEKAEFIKVVTTGILPPPQYFPKNAALNKLGYEELDAVMSKGLLPLSVDEVADAQERGALILDTRSKENFSASNFIPKSWFIGLDGSFASWVGTLITDMKRPLVVITDPGKEEEAVLRLARVGYTHVLGYLEGGFAAWEAAGKPVDSINTISVSDLETKWNAGSLNILDVRKPTEWEAEHLEGSENVPLNYIHDQMDKVDGDKTYYAHCKSGFRSLIFSTVLKSKGYHNVIDIDGGFDAILESGLKTTEFICPTTLEA